MLPPQIQPGVVRVIGFDLGHGDSSVSSVDPGHQEPVHHLDIAPRHRVVPTVVALAAGRTLVGEEAATTRRAERRWQQFKSRHVHDPAVGEPLRLFTAAVFDGLRANNDLGADEDQLLVVFGHPSGWQRDDEVQQYLGVLAAQVPRAQVVPMRESAAAFLAIKDEGHIPRSDRDGIIVVVDLGSSTTDITVVKDSEQAELEAGDRLGAGLVEQALLDRVIDTSPHAAVIRAWLEREPIERSRALFQVRRLKEVFYRQEAAHRNPDHPRRVKDVIEFTPGDDDVDLEVSLTAADFDWAVTSPLEALGGESWQGHLAGLVDETLRVLGDERPTLVIVTGGAARMSFVLDIVKERIGDGDTFVRRAENPEHTISTGLALAGAQLCATSAFSDEMDAFLDSDAIAEAVTAKLPDLAKTLGKIAAEMAVPVMLDVMGQWRIAEGSTLEEVPEAIAVELQSRFETDEIQKEVLEVTLPWYTSVEADVQELARPISERYDVSAELLVAKGIRLEGIQVDAGQLRALTSLYPHQVVDTVSKVVVPVVMTCFLWLVAAMLPTIGMTALIGGLFAVASLLVRGEKVTKESLHKMLQQRNLPPWLKRTLVREKGLNRAINDKRSEIEADIATAMVKGFMAPDGAESRARIVAEVAAVLEANLRGRVTDLRIFYW